eukprot:5273369-Pyramimonas_sp.AAC.1
MTPSVHPIAFRVVGYDGSSENKSGSGLRAAPTRRKIHSNYSHGLAQFCFNACLFADHFDSTACSAVRSISHARFPPYGGAGRTGVSE